MRVLGFLSPHRAESDIMEIRNSKIGPQGFPDFCG